MYVLTMPGKGANEQARLDDGRHDIGAEICSLADSSYELIE